MTKAILVINAGSSSIKFAVYKVSELDADPGVLSLLARGQVVDLHMSRKAQFELSISGQTSQIKPLPDVHNHRQAIRQILTWINQSTESWQLVAVGHRVVHGGSDFNKPIIVNDQILKQLIALESLAPLHQPNNLAAIKAVSKVLPDIVQVACFDTAFHATQEIVQSIFPIPKKYRDKGLKKYGFHGLSYEYLVQELTDYSDGKLPEKLIIAHLGNGASACAIKNGQSVSSTMGFSTLDGLVMGSRCGSIDPGVLIHLLKTEKMTVDELSVCLYEESGLLGLSGISSDIRELESSDNQQAEMALQVYLSSFLKHIAALASVLQGLDAIVFSGGVGENSVFIRQQILTQIKWLGCEIDIEANQQGKYCITEKLSKVQAYVIPANEELIIARFTQELCLEL